MRALGFVLVVISFVGSCSIVVHADEIAHGDRMRSFIPDVPQGLQMPAPTMFVLNGCIAEILNHIGSPGTGPEVTLTVHRHAGCTDDVDLRLYAFLGMGHRWPGGNPLPAAFGDLMGPAPRGFPVQDEIWSFLADKHLSTMAAEAIM